MAGANNAQLKKAYRARDVQKARAEYGAVSHAVMERAGFAPKKGHERPAKVARARSASVAPRGWQAAARGEGGEQRRAATAARESFMRGREEGRRVFQAGETAANQRVADNRRALRALIGEIRKSEGNARALGKDLGKARKGRGNSLVREMIADILGSPKPKRVADLRGEIEQSNLRARVGRAVLARHLGIRNEIAKARKAESTAKRAGQRGLFD